MKKRRELDALVNGKTGRRKKKGQHELLRNDTDSSDVEEFAIPPKAIVRKHNSLSRFCSACVTVCGFFLLTSCMVAIAGLVWVHVELKREVDNLRTEVDKVKSDHDTSNTDYESVRSQQSNIAKQLEDLKKTLADQKQTIETLTENFHTFQTESAADNLDKSEVQKLRRLPSKFDELQSQAANEGAEISSLKQDVTTLLQSKTDVEHSLQDIENQLQEIKNPEIATTTLPSPLATPAQAAEEDITRLTQAITAVNQSLSEQFHSLQSRTDIHMSQLFNMTQRLDQRISVLELHPSTEISVNNGDMDELVQHAVQNALLGMSHADYSANITQRVNQLSENVVLLQNQCTAVNVTKLIEESKEQETTYVNDKIAVLNSKTASIDQRLVTIEGEIQYLNSLQPTQSPNPTTVPVNKSISQAIPSSIAPVQSQNIDSLNSETGGLSSTDQHQPLNSDTGSLSSSNQHQLQNSDTGSLSSTNQHQPQNSETGSLSSTNQHQPGNA